MKTAKLKTSYNIVLILLCAIALLSFLPWLYDIAFPAQDSAPFLSWSPVSKTFVVSETGDTPQIYLVDAEGNTSVAGLSKNQRDSLVPQMYFNQLIARNALPDTIDGIAIDAPALKSAQWVFSSLPRDINRAAPRVYPIMESLPKRVDLEDPTEVFTLEDDIRFIDMATNTINQERSSRFAKVFAERGFTFPARSAHADITAKKAYDEGYILIDAANKLYHMKMQAGQPYLAHIAIPEDETPVNAFILENPDRALIALVATAAGNLYAIERNGYKPVKLPVANVDPAKQRIVIMHNLFNWVVRLSDNSSTRWIAIDSRDYSLLGEYRREHHKPLAAEIARYIFPIRIDFTDIDDCYAYPRIVLNN